MRESEIMRARAAFKELLEFADTITEARLLECVPRLPADVRGRLAAGPLQRRYSCGVCEAFGSEFYTGLRDVDIGDPRWIVWLYHEAPKRTMNHRDQLHFGELANEIYRRCLATYRAAGWTGEASEPDA